MSTRFRYRNAEGAQVDVPDLDTLQQHVAYGRVRDSTELFDALTGVTAPAREHAAYRLISDLDDPGDRGEDGQLRVPGLEITLAEASEPATTEEVVRELERRRSREAEAGLDRVPSTEVRRLEATPHLLDDDESRVDPDVLDDMAPPEDESSPDTRAGADEPEEPPARPSSADDEKGPGIPTPGPSPASPNREVRRKRRTRTRLSGVELPDVDLPLWMLDGFGRARGGEAERARRRVARRRRTASGKSVARVPFLAALGATVVVVAGYVGLEAAADEPVDTTERVDLRRIAPPPVDLVGVADGLSDSGRTALQHMVEGMDSVAGALRVRQVPNAWLETRYFVEVDQHPEVLSYWRRYRGFVAELRREDERLFREGFVSRLEALDVSPSIVALRLAQGLRSFDRSEEERTQVYDLMESLADQAIELHEELLVWQPRIQYDPGARMGAASDPFLQFVTDEPALRDEILRRLDGILGTLEELHGDGPTTRDRLNQGVLEGLRRANGR